MKKSLGVYAVGTFIVAIGLLIASRQQTNAGFGTGMQPPIGKTCSIQFRRGDALGSGANLPVAPLTGSINGAETSVGGKLKAATDEWLVLEYQGSELWIPKASVLLIRF